MNRQNTRQSLPSDTVLDQILPATRAGFREIRLATPEDYEIIHQAESAIVMQTGERLLAYLARLDVANGTPLTILDHALQTATRAAEDGRDDEYVVCALLHDIGDLLSPLDHGAMAGAILQPWVSDAHHWMVRHHSVFQMAYQSANSQVDPAVREAYRGSTHFELTAEFCERYDQRSFDPDYPSAPLSEFAPLLQKVFDPARLAAGGRTPVAR